MNHWSVEIWNFTENKGVRILVIYLLGERFFIYFNERWRIGMFEKFPLPPCCLPIIAPLLLFWRIRGFGWVFLFLLFVKLSAEKNTICLICCIFLFKIVTFNSKDLNMNNMLLYLQYFKLLYSYLLIPRWELN